jgi:hypothetical protein
MNEVFDLTTLSSKVSQLEKQLIDKQKEIDYYKKIAQEAGLKRLREINQMSQLIEERKIAEKEREKVIEKLQVALNEVKTLQGFIPICASCKKIRDDGGYWNLIEEYIQEHSEATFSHSMCPECSDRLYGEEAWYLKVKKKREGNK